MPLNANTRLDHYEIIAPLGAGGMGEVYRARDTRLDREVAIKVLPADFAQDAERLKRFEQEARATSTLNHPNILTVHDFGLHEGAPYLVAELLAGEELRAQLNAGALTPKRAIDYAQQVAAGLAAAHERGVVHRDLKPENLFVTHDGRVKILDFGLAKLKPQKIAGGVDSEAETMKPLTNPGVIMGTVGYMSPEQVRGQETDHRSDIFSFGLILHEMLSGQRTFAGDSLVELMNAILKEEPAELSETNAKISPALDKIVRRCLEKKPEHRFHSAHDLGFALGTLTTPSGSRVETAMALPALTESLPAAGKAGWFGNARLWMAVAAATTLGLLLALPFAVKYLRQAPPVEAVAGHFVIPSPEQATELLLPLLAPDGRNLVFRARVDGRYSLWLRPLGSLAAQKLPGTEDVSAAHFWSPDSRSIGFVTEGILKRLDLAGGAPQTLCPMPDPDLGERAGGGGTWNRDGVILFVSGGNLWRVPAMGGEPALVLKNTQPNREAGYRFPDFLPDGRHFLLVRLNEQSATSDICLATLDGREPVRLLTADSNAIYAPAAAGSGQLLFARTGALLAQPFDAESLKLTGEPFRVAEQVQVSRTSRRGYFSVSGNGSLVYSSSGVNVNRQLTWVDRTGKLLESVSTPGNFGRASLSPDGKRVAVARMDPQTKTRDIYVTDLARGVSSRLTFDPANEDFPVWSPDGNRIAWMLNREKGYPIYQKLASGVGPEELLIKLDERSNPDDWSADGRFLLYTREDQNTKNDLWVLPMVGDRQPSLFFQSPFHEGWGRFSPDGRWVAYQTNDQNRPEVNVQPFPATGAKWQISTNGGALVRWRRDGKEMFYQSADNKLMAVEVKSGSSFEAGVPKVLFDLTPLRVGSTLNGSYDVSADGQRFLFVPTREEAASLQFTVVVNWAAEAKR